VNAAQSLAIDHYILDGSSERRREVESALSTSAPDPYVIDFVDALKGGTARQFNVSPIAVGPYLASRMLLRGFSLSSDLRGCMYALTDCVRSVDVINALRWHFVLERYPDELARSNTARQMLGQSARVLGILLLICDDRELGWERSFLNVIP
jgi:hypothetical protein